LLSSFCFGQKEPVYVGRLVAKPNGESYIETRFYEAVDRWVAFDVDSAYMVGFIYMDEQAGFTFHFEAMYLKTKDGLKRKSGKLDGSIVKHRLGGNTPDVIMFLEKQVEELGLPKVPEWLHLYKKNENENSYLVGMGYSYNHVGASHKAIEPLLKVYNKEPHFKGLEFELAYAYNATGDFEKAIEVLNKAIKNEPKNFWFYRELGFSLLNQNKIDDAEKIYMKGIELSTKQEQQAEVAYNLSTKKEQQAEMAYNMAYNYFKAKNKPKFEKWAKLTKQYAETNSEIHRRINYFQENWDK
jgi:tetratricopeptide (TPR) repeat protein